MQFLAILSTSFRLGVAFWKAIISMDALTAPWTLTTEYRAFPVTYMIRNLIDDTELERMR